MDKFIKSTSETPVKVLYVIDTLETGGAERSLLEIASRLLHLTPVVCHLYQGETLKPKFETAGIKVISIDLKGSYQFIQAYKELKKVCLTEKPDLIVSALYRSEIISRVVARKLRIVQIGSLVSDSYSENKKSTFTFLGRLKFKIFYWINVLTAGLSAAYIANSESIKLSSSKALKIPLDKIHTIYRGRTVKANPGTRQADAMPLKFLNVGRLIKGKGQSELIQAFAKFLQSNPESTLTIAGDGPYRPELEHLIVLNKLVNKVYLLGNIDNVSQLYIDHDCLVFPSHYEGFSGVLVEAMLHKIPVLASDIPMNLEAIVHNKTGYIFTVKNEDSILKAMEWFYTHRDNATVFAEEAYKEACRRFDSNVIVRQHEDLYSEVVGKFYSQ